MKKVKFFDIEELESKSCLAVIQTYLLNEVRNENKVKLLMTDIETEETFICGLSNEVYDNESTPDLKGDSCFINYTKVKDSITYRELYDLLDKENVENFVVVYIEPTGEIHPFRFGDFVGMVTYKNEKYLFTNETLLNF